MIKMHDDRRDKDIPSVPPHGWDKEDVRGLSPPASTVLNSSFSQVGDHGHSDVDAEELRDSDEDGEERNEMEVLETGLAESQVRRRAEVGLP